MSEPLQAKRRISVIVPHFNDLVRLDTCLAALDRQTLERDRYDVIVVDNASPCGIEAVRRIVNNRARLILCSTPGAGPARNAGVTMATAPLLAFIDADCVPQRDWLAHGLAALQKAPIIGGQVDVTVRNTQGRSGAEAFEQIFAFDNRRYVEQERFSVTANLFTTRALFERVGGFRGTVSEDTDWCRRAVAQGHAIAFCAAARVSHPAREDWAQLRKKWQRIQRESFALAGETPLGKRWWALRSLALPASILVHAPRIFASRRLARWPERLSAFCTLVRLRLWRFADALRLVRSDVIKPHRGVQAES